MPTDEVPDDDAALAHGRVFETDEDHAVAVQAAAPALVAVLTANHARGEEFGVAGRADVVVAGGALVAVEARLARLDGVLADVAVGAESEGTVLGWAGEEEVRGLMEALQQAGGCDWCEYGGVDVLLGACSRILGFLQGRSVGDGE